MNSIKPLRLSVSAVIFLSIAMIGPLTAQVKKEEKLLDQKEYSTIPPKDSMRTFQIRHLNSREQMNNLVMTLQRVLQLTKFSSDNDRKIVVVRAPLEVLDNVERIIKDMDVPKKNASFSCFVLKATNEAIPSNEMPNTLEPVIEQLKGTLAYKNYQLIDTLLARGIEGTAIKMSGNFPLKPVAGARMVNLPQSVEDISSSDLELSFQVSHVEKERVLNITLEFRVKIPIKNEGKIEFINSAISTSLDLHEGQMAVVGKTSVAGLPAENLILVISAKVLD